MIKHPIENIRSGIGYKDDDFVIAVVGSQFLYRGLWLEHALVLRALNSVLESSSNGLWRGHLKVAFLGGSLNSNYTRALKVSIFHLRIIELAYIYIIRFASLALIFP